MPQNHFIGNRILKGPLTALLLVLGVLLIGALCGCGAQAEAESPAAATARPCPTIPRISCC